MVSYILAQRIEKNAFPALRMVVLLSYKNIEDVVERWINPLSFLP